MRMRLLLSILLLSIPGSALALRCAGGLVTPGDHMVEVLAACGEPDFRDRVVEHPVRMNRISGVAHLEYLPLAVVSEEWVYDFGAQRFRQLLRFRNNRLSVIEPLGKPRR